MRSAPPAADDACDVSGEIVVMDAEPGAFWFGAFRNFNLLVWPRGANLDAVERLERTNPARTQAHPERISTVHIITPTASGPSPEARDAFNEMHARWGSTVGCAAIVIERGGLMGVAVRSAIAGMTMLAPKHFRVKVFDTIEAAAPWVVEHHARSTGVTVTLRELSAALRFARNSCTAV